MIFLTTLNYNTVYDILMCCRRESSELKTRLEQATQALKTSEVSLTNLE